MPKFRKMIKEYSTFRIFHNSDHRNRKFYTIEFDRMMIDTKRVYDIMIEFAVPVDNKMTVYDNYMYRKWKIKKDVNFDTCSLMLELTI